MVVCFLFCFVFFVCVELPVSYIFNSLSYIVLANIFSQSIGCLFTLIIISLPSQRFLVFCSSTCLFCFWCHIQEITAKTSIKSLFLMFFPRGFTVPDLIFEYFLWVDFCDTCKAKIHFHYSECKCPSLPSLEVRFSFL